MGDSLENTSIEKSVRNTNVTPLKKKPAITLKQILKGDKDVRDFYKMVDQLEFRQRAYDILTARIDKMN